MKESIEQLEDFPVHRPSFFPSNLELQNAIYNNNKFDDGTKLRLACFMYVWGDGTLQTYEKKGVRYVAGLSENVYKELGLPIIDGNKVDVPTEDTSTPSIDLPQPEGTGAPVRDKENEQVMIAMQFILDTSQSNFERDAKAVLNSMGNGLIAAVFSNITAPFGP